MSTYKFENIIKDNQVTLDLIKSKTVGVIGYGNQGRAQALNLYNSNINVIVGLRKGSNSENKVLKDDLNYASIEEVVDKASIISLLVPDKIIPEVWNNSILPNLKANQTILFSHGYNVHYKLIDIPDFINVIMVAPSGGGAVVRTEYLNNNGVPTLLAVYQDVSKNSDILVKEYSKAIGGTKVCAFMSTFKEETETDLFGEQAILTGGLPYLINQSFKSLVKAGYSPTVAWFVCYYELKTIINLFHKNGFKYLYESISDTARYGGILKGKYLMDSDLDKKLDNMIEDIKSGKFHKDFTSSTDIKDFSDFSDIEELNKEFIKLITKKDNN